MIILIILIAIVAVSIYAIIKDKIDEFFAIPIIVFAGVLLIFHSVAYVGTEYKYEKFEVNKIAIEQTLKKARERGNEYETSAIMKDVVSINRTIAEKQFKNKKLFLDQYIDDRFESMKPIE